MNAPPHVRQTRSRFARLRRRFVSRHGLQSSACLLVARPHRSHIRRLMTPPGYRAADRSPSGKGGRAIAYWPGQSRNRRASGGDDGRVLGAQSSRTARIGRLPEQTPARAGAGFPRRAASWWACAARSSRVTRRSQGSAGRDRRTGARSASAHALRVPCRQTQARVATDERAPDGAADLALKPTICLPTLHRSYGLVDAVTHHAARSRPRLSNRRHDPHDFPSGIRSSRRGSASKPHRCRPLPSRTTARRGSR